jgi:Tfp pilus assembly protein PilW
MTAVSELSPIGDFDTENEKTSETGLTLIELLIYTILGSIVLVMVGGILIQSLQVQKTVGNTNSAASSGQLVAASVERGVRTSTTVAWSSSASGELLVARTNNSVGTVSCGYDAWYWANAGTGAIYYNTSASAITEPSSGQLATWTKLATGIQKSGTTLIFTVAGQQVAVRFNVAVGTDTPLPIKTTAVSNGTTLESSQC